MYMDDQNQHQLLPPQSQMIPHQQQQGIGLTSSKPLGM